MSWLLSTAFRITLSQDMRPASRFCGASENKVIAIGCAAFSAGSGRGRQHGLASP